MMYTLVYSTLNAVDVQYNHNNNNLVSQMKGDNMCNEIIRNKITESRLTHWQVADACGISACTLSVWLRKELSGDKKRRVENAIDALATQQRGAVV